MNAFTLHLQEATGYERVEDAVSFVGSDATGSFGIQRGHERFLTAMTFGIARYRTLDGVWHYLALPGGLLYVRDGEVFLNSRRFIRDTDYRRISETLERELAAEAESLHAVRVSLEQMEEAMLRRLWHLDHEQSA